jgi:hypothetical protein
MKNVLIGSTILVLALFGTGAVSAPETTGDQRIFDVSTFGAVGDGVTMDTRPIQEAIDTCSATGGGTVIVPAGTYNIGPIEMKSMVHLFLEADAVLSGATDIETYQKLPYLVHAQEATRFAITGQGRIIGNGHVFPARKPDGSWAFRPRLMRFERCSDIILRDITLENSASWCTHMVLCSAVNVDGITIHNRVNQNNDGLDFDSCTEVRVSNCYLDCGDDAIALKTNYTEPCKNITVTNCVMTSRWAAFRFGPEARGNFEDITVSNCVIHDTFGTGIKLQMNEGAVMRNILFSGLTMTNVSGPISMRLAGWRHGILSRDNPEGMPIGRFENVVITGLRATIAERPGVNVDVDLHPFPGEERSCISITGLPGHPIEGITLSDIHITFPGGGTADEAARREIPDLPDTYPEYFMFGVLPSWGLYAHHIRGLVLHNITFDLDTPDLRPAIVLDDAETVMIDGFRVEGNTGAESVLRFVDTADAFLTGCNLLTPSSVFLQVEGGKSRDILIDGCNLLKAESPVKTDRGAGTNAVTIRD